MKNRFLVLASIVTLLFSNVYAEDFWSTIKNERVTSIDSIEWVNFGPGMAGYNEEFWCHPTDPNTMFMGPDMHVAYGTWDNAETWHSIKDCDGDGYDLQRVHDIAFSSVDPDYCVAIEREGLVFESTNRGRNWTQVADIGKAYTKMAIHPEDDKTWLIGAGDFWNVKNNHRTLAKPEGITHTRAEYGFVQKTTDGGKTWTKVATDLSSNLDVGRIIYNPIHTDSVIMATAQGMYISGDGGESWTSSSTGLPYNHPRDMSSYYNKDTKEFILYMVEQTVYSPQGTGIKTSGGVYKSTNGGLSWTSVTGNLGVDFTVITDYTERDRFHRTVSHWLGIDKATSKATYTTYPMNTYPVFNRLVINPKNKDEIYLVHNIKHDRGFGPGEMFKTEDGGKTWFVCARDGKYWVDGSDVAYWRTKGNPSNSNIEFAHLQRYMDEGSASSGNRSLAINSLGHVFIGVDQQTLRSEDNGDSWFQIDDKETFEGSNKWVGRGGSNLPGRYMLLETGIRDRYLLCSGEHGLWQTVDIGRYADQTAVAVEQIEGQIRHNGAHSASTVAVHPNNPNKIYMLMWRQEHRGKLRMSSDGGNSWTNIATIFEANNNSWENLITQYSLVIDPIDPLNMYFCSVREPLSEVGHSDGSELTKGEIGVYRSNDGGYTWNVSTTGFPADASIHRIAMHPDDPSIFYAALNQFRLTDPFGLYKSTDKTESWSKVTIPSEITSVNNVFIDRNTKDIFISCGNRSGTYNGGGVWKSTDDGATWSKIFYAPYVWQTEVSPANSDIILVTVPAQIPTKTKEFMNPAIYLTVDGGDSWSKINKGLGQPNKMVDVKPDPYDENVLWSAGWGSGWFKATINGNNVTSLEDTQSQLLKIHPIPAEDILNVDSEMPLLGATIFDLNGKLILASDVASRIDVSSLDSGVYFINVRTEHGSIQRKIIIA